MTTTNQPRKVFLFVLSLLVFSTELFSQITRSPYLQKGHKTGITIRWRTTAASNSRVRIGTTYDASGNYPTIIDDASSVTEHIVDVTGLTADTKYYYSVGTSTTVQQVGVNNFFTTAPPANTTRKVRIAVFGDCGQESSATNQNASHLAYRNFLTANSIDAADALLLLGDNAYNVGSDVEYTNKFFTPYDNAAATNPKSILRNHKIFPSPGNHEYNNAGETSTGFPNRRLRTWSYFTNFSIPQAGECGGFPSNKPNYYSFDMGNIHFLALDSWGMEGTDADSHMGTAIATATVMRTWITNDLNAVALLPNPPKWIVAYWHHAPYTKGTHNSDTEAQLIAIRQNFNTFLESKGVDLILGGHSHAYERSYLIKNYTGNWASFNVGTHAVSSSSAKYNGAANSGPYKYNSTPLNHGAVYVVSANAGANNGSLSGFGGATSVMPAAHGASTQAGFFYFEVEDNRLDAKSIISGGTEVDRFTIMKDVNKTTNQTIALGQSATLTASWPATAGTYVWTGAGASGTNRSTSVTPSTTGTFNFTVSDNIANSGLLDNFTVTVTGTLPVTFANFTAEKNASGVAVNWTVSEIINHDYFSIERSEDGLHFVEISRNNENINGASSRSFIYNDVNPPQAPVLYYRIKQCDVNGSCKYTDVRAVRFDEKKKAMLYPVPADNTVNIVYANTNVNKITITIADENGRIIKNEIRNVTAGRNTVQLDISKLKTGNYIVIITDGKEKWTEKLIKL